MDQSNPIEQAIQTLESQRAILGDAAVNAAIEALRAQLQQEQRQIVRARQFTGERKLVTIMFADISGFTGLLETHDPEVIRTLMNDCFDHLVPVIKKYEGTIDKFIGDEIMALFGAPKAHERHAEFACSAALEMFQALKEFNAKSHTALGLHIGINTGLVIAGGIGSAGRKEYSVIGDAVNLAARLRDSANTGEIFVGEKTYQMTRHQFGFAALEPILLKGKALPVQIFHLQEQKQRPGSRGKNHLQSELIGRQAELGELVTALGSLQAGEGQVLAIIGEAGLGKSRLVTEAQRQTESKLHWIEGRALSYTRQNTYQPAIEIISKLIGAPSPIENLKLKQRLWRDLQQKQLPHLLPYLSRMMQLPLTEEEEIPVKYLHADALIQSIFAAFSEYLQTYTRQRPLVLVWEDLHWADASSLALIEYSMSVCRTAPLAFLLIFRPRKEERIWKLHTSAKQLYGQLYRIIALESLSDRDSSILMRRLLRSHSLTPDLERFLLEKAEGNPFFLEEIVRSLLDKNPLLREKAVLKPSLLPETLEIPDTLQGVIASRIDALEEIDKRTLQTASVLGRIFPRKMLTVLLSQSGEVMEDQLELDQILARLTDRELLRRRSSNGAGTEYIFKHAVTHDVTYESLLHAERKNLHRLAGEALAGLADHSEEDAAEILAYHFERADQPEKAVKYLCLAADRAKRVHANDEAVGLYRKAIRQIEELQGQTGNKAELDKMMAQLLENIGDVLELTGQNEEAQNSYRSAKERLDAMDWIGRCRVHRKIGRCYQATSQFEAELASFDQAEENLMQWSAPKDNYWWNEWIELMLERIFLHYWTGRTDLMQSLSDQVYREIQQHGSPAQQRRYFENLLLMRFRKEVYLVSEETVALSLQVMEAAERMKDVRQLALAQFLRGFALLWFNQISKAIFFMESSLEIAERIGDIVLQSRNLTYLAVSHRRHGNVSATEYYAGLSLKTAEEAGMLEYVGTAYGNMAWLAWKKGKYKQVAALGELAWKNWKKIPNVHSSLVFVWIAAWPRAAFFADQGNLPGFIRMMKEMLQPDRKNLEHELTMAMQQLVDDPPPTAPLAQKAMEEVLQLAQQYRYL